MRACSRKRPHALPRGTSSHACPRGKPPVRMHSFEERPRMCFLEERPRTCLREERFPALASWRERPCMRFLEEKHRTRFIEERPRTRVVEETAGRVSTRKPPGEGLGVGPRCTVSPGRSPRRAWLLEERTQTNESEKRRKAAAEKGKVAQRRRRRGSGAPGGEWQDVGHDASPGEDDRFASAPRWPRAPLRAFAQANRPLHASPRGNAPARFLEESHRA